MRSNNQGSLASRQGKILEDTVEATFRAKGFDVVNYRIWHKNPKKYTDDLLLKNCPFTTIYTPPWKYEIFIKFKKI